MDLFTCPLCLESLMRHDRVLKCGRNHSFDIAREGYVNLLPPQHRRSREPGDSGEMIAARNRFLNAGHYTPLATALTGMVIASASCDPLVDLGCGEGYFTSSLSKRIANVYGVDISKAAIKTASKRSKTISLCVASTARLPLIEQSFHAATIVMAPISRDVVRILKPGGRLFRVTPGPDHLNEIKQLIYQDVRAHRRANIDLSNLTLIESRRVTSETMLSKQSRGDLVAMTPMRYRTAQAAPFQTEAADELLTTTDFVIDVFERV